MENYLNLEDKGPQPVLLPDGALQQLTLLIAGKRYVCPCRCNVFNKPDRENLDLYECNSCGHQFEAA